MIVSQSVQLSSAEVIILHQFILGDTTAIFIVFQRGSNEITDNPTPNESDYIYK